MIICFDIGGVLVRICRSWNEGCIAAGVPVRSFDEDAAHRGRIHDIVHELQRGALEDHEFHRGVSDLYRGVWSPEEVARIDAAWLLGPYEGTADLIRDLDAAGRETACLSNTSGGHWKSLLEFECVSRLQHRHASHLLGLVKPDPDIYLAFERLTGGRPGEIVFFDDLEANVAAATDRGWDAVRIDHETDTARQMREALADRGLI